MSNGVNVVIDEEQRGRSDYIAYLQRCTRTTNISLVEMHHKALSKEVMKQYGVSNDEELLVELRRLDNGVVG